MNAVICFFVALLFLPTASTKNDDCVARCDRLHARLISRMGLEPDKVTALLEKQRPPASLKDICWRLYDRLDCLKRCPKDRELEKYARDVRFKCKGALKELEKPLKCVSKYRSFMQVKCSTFLKEAVTLRVAHSILEPDSVPNRQTCHYLHLNSLCLENTVGTYCPDATKVFRRLNFRDYFLNFIVPENDQLFDDVDLDSCQIYDFVKSAQVTSDEFEEELTTMINNWEDEAGRKTTAMRETTTREVTTIPPRKTTFQEKKEFTTLLNELLSSTESIEIPSSTSAETLTPSLRRVVPTETKKEGYSTNKVHLTTVDSSLDSEEILGSTLQIEETTRPAFTKKTILEEGTTASHETSPDRSIDNEILIGSAANEATTQILELSPPDERAKSYYSTSIESTSHIPSSTWNSIKPTTENLGDVIEILPSSRRVFSDDSMENTPPNFFYSSARYRTSTLSANNGRHLSSLEIVEPVEVDTSTLLGEDYFQGPVETVSWTDKPLEVTLSSPTVDTNSINTTPKTTGRIVVVFSPKAEAGSISQKPIKVKATTPLLSGSIVVKSIKRWGEPESDEGEEEKVLKPPMVDEEEFDKLMEKEDEYDYADEETTQHPLSDKEILLFIYLILFGLALLALICILTFCICCRRKVGSYDINTKY